MSATLGAFQLIEPLGEGGMADVWLGRHATGVEVAIKLIRRHEGAQRARPEQFAAEVRAMAALDHPSVVQVLDFGEVAPDGGAHEALHAGQKWLAMELCRGGDLADRPPAEWSEVLEVTRAILRALAYSHARGVLHRDLKPANVLIGEGPTGARQFKLTDFGLAFALDAESGESTASGTPRYMAPEQLLAQWRNFGPWTDLYALGVTVWRLVCGETPFEGAKDFRSLALRKINQELPALRPKMAIPPELEAWLRRLLQRTSTDRYLRAADALFVLDQMGLASRPASAAAAEQAALSTGDVSRRHGARTVLGGSAPAASSAPLDATEVRGDDATLPSSGALIAPQSGAAAPPIGSLLAPRPQPLLSRDWQRHEPVQDNLQLLGAGLALFPLRDAPLVDRTTPRDRLWKALRQATEHGRAHAVVLQGAAGVGKSRLALWLAERGHADGTCTPLRAVHSASAGAGEGLPGMLSRHLRCAGMTRDELLLHCKSICLRDGVTEPYEFRALAELVAPSAPSDALGVRFASRSERFAVLTGHLERWAQRRPLLLWLDDIHWGADALAFAEFLVARQDRQPLAALIVLTGRDDLLRERGVEQGLLLDLLGHDDVGSVRIAAMETDDTRALIESLLPLTGTLCDTIEKRADGNPLFAVQLVRDWVERGILAQESTGFALAAGADARIPDDLHALWSERIDKLIAVVGPAARLPLQLAAALGVEVDLAEWRAVCGQLDAPIPEQLLDHLLAARLITADRYSFRFEVGLLTESLLRRADEAGHREGIEIGCARMLRQMYAASQSGLAGRLARHLLAAKAWGAALDPLLEAAKEAGNGGEFGVASRWVATWTQAAQSAKMKEGDERRAEPKFLEVKIAAYQGETETAARYAEKLLIQAERERWITGRQFAHLAVCTVSLHRSAHQALASHATQAIEACGKDSRNNGEALRFSAIAATMRGDKTSAAAAFRSAIESFAVDDRPRSVVYDCQRRLLACEIPTLALSTTAALNQIAVAARAQGWKGLQAAVANDLGEYYAGVMDFEQAQAAYQLAYNLWVQMGSAEIAIGALNLGLIAQNTGAFLAADARFQEAGAMFAEQGDFSLEALAHLKRAAVLVSGDRLTAQKAVTDAQRALNSGGELIADAQKELNSLAKVVGASKAEPAEIIARLTTQFSPN
jgi:hypothetical protein